MERLSEINALKSRISEIINSPSHTKSELTGAVKMLGRLNAMAYKGYRRLTDEQCDINYEIYTFKDDALKKLVKLYMDMGMNVGGRDSIVYFRGIDTIQISFHCSHSLVVGLPPRTWDMVPDSYIYGDENKRQYNYVKKAMRESFKAWVKEVDTYQKNLKSAYKKYIKHHMRRKKIGIECSYVEACDIIDNIKPGICEEQGKYDYWDVYNLPWTRYNVYTVWMADIEKLAGEKPRKFRVRDEYILIREHLFGNNNI